MAIETQTEDGKNKVQPTGGAAAGGAAAGATGATGATGASEKKTDAPVVGAAVGGAAAGAAGATGATGAAGPSKTKVSGDDDEIPTDKEILEMTPKALQSRLDRFSKKQLKENFGTSDPEEIKAKLKKLAEHEEKAEADRLKQLSEIERERELKKKADERADAAEERANALEAERAFATESARVSKVAEKYLDEDYVEVEIPRFARWLTKTYTAKQLEKLTDAEEAKIIDGYFKERVEKKPKIGKDYKPVARADETTTHSNGASTKERPNAAAPSGQNATKTAAPGKANSMTDAEFREYKKSRGLSF